MKTPVTETSRATRGGGRRLRTLIGRHKRLVAGIAVMAVGLGVFGFLWFRPDKLFVNKTVDEALPAIPAAASPAPRAASPASQPEEPAPSPKAPAAAAQAPARRATPPPAPAGPDVISTGAFRSLEHETSGTANVLRYASGSLVVRFEDFRTSNGPDLVVILSDTPATEDEWSAYDDGEFVNIGALKGNVGNQNYTVPDGVDIAKYRSVVVWCRRFNVAFGAAPIRLEA